MLLANSFNIIINLSFTIKLTGNTIVLRILLAFIVILIFKGVTSILKF